MTESSTLKLFNNTSPTAHIEKIHCQGMMLVNSVYIMNWKDAVMTDLKVLSWHY